MKNKSVMLLAGVITLGLVGCASTPSMDEMTQLSAEEYKAAISGNTWTSKHDWGKWAEYMKEDGTGFAKASGSWGTETATSIYSVDDEGEGCWTYSGDAEWSSAEFKYCSVMFVDQEGNHYSKTTQNNRKPERVGRVTKIVFEPGDSRGLEQ